jgi:hypothetical protein
LFCDSWVENDGTIQILNYRRPASSKATLDFRATLRGGEVHKKIALDANILVVEYAFTKPLEGDFKVELNLAMPSCDGPAGRFNLDGNIPGGFGQALKLIDIKHIGLEDEVLGGAIHLHCNVACNFDSRPHFSVSQSEAGFEKIMQAVTLELRWPMAAIKDKLEIRLEVI